MSNFGSFFWVQDQDVIGNTFASLVDYDKGIELLCTKGFINEFVKKALLTHRDLEFYKNTANNLCDEDILLLFSMKGIDKSNPIYRKFYRDLGTGLHEYFKTFY